MLPSLLFAVALVLALGLTPVVTRLAVRLGILDRPEPRKVHSTPIPLMGGAAMYAAVLIPLLLFLDLDAERRLIGLVAGGTLLLAAGILDDLGFVRYYIKIVLAIPLAAVVLIASGARLALPESIGFLSLGASLLWVVAVTSAFSILDHLDGLCAGVAAVASTFFLIFGLVYGQPVLAMLAAIYLGATVGFLRWNFNPARIFMGDGGAMFLGFSMAALGLELQAPQPALAADVLIPALILGVPLLDSTLVTISRARRGVNPFTTPGKDHAGHRLASLGLGVRGAVLSLYGLGALLGLSALWLPMLVGWQAILLILLVLAGGITAIARLEAVAFERQETLTRVPVRALEAPVVRVAASRNGAAGRPVPPRVPAPAEADLP